MQYKVSKSSLIPQYNDVEGRNDRADYLDGAIDHILPDFNFDFIKTTFKNLSSVFFEI